MSASALRTGLIAVAFSGAFATACEVAARTRIAADLLPAPSYGTRIRFFDMQMARLAAQARSEGGVDCLIFGSSAVLYGLDPKVFSDVRSEKDGERLRCFNFGLPGATAWDVRALAKVLARDYRPRLILYGFTPRDVGAAARGLQLHTTPWIKRRTEAFSFDGHLTDVSAAFRYFLAWRRWLNPSRPEPVAMAPVRSDGFSATPRTLTADAVLTGWALEVVGQAGTYDPRSFSGLVDLAAEGIEVVVAELPRSPALVSIRLAGIVVSHDSEEYRRFAAQLAHKAKQVGATFIAAPEPDVVPADGWADLVHMNGRGAGAFTAWLAGRIPRPDGTGEAASAPAASPGA